MKVVIGGDHAGFEYIQKIITQLKHKNYEVVNLGPSSNNPVDYPDFVRPVVTSIQEKTADFGILVCGSGNGVAMVANKYTTIRAALCWNTDLAKAARNHNDANILCIPARYVAYEYAQRMVESFLDATFEKGRHQRRVNKIDLPE